MHPAARIRLLGRLEVRLGGDVLTLMESVRAESLLAYLLLNRDAAVPRQRVAFDLWPDSAQAQARTNLRHVLHTLRHRLPDAERFLEVTPRTLRWRPDATCSLDVAAFEQLLETRGDARFDALRQAVDLYRGDLMDGCFDEWLLPERDRLRRLQLDALAELSALCEARAEVTEAVSYAERLLRDDPLREESYRQLMRLHSTRGDRARALSVYHACSSILDGELGVEPSPETRSAYEALLPSERATRPAATRVGEPPLVGRTAERGKLAEAWRSAEAGQARCVVVSGEAGVGKTRLVEEFLAWCGRRGVVTAEAHCYRAEGSLAYGPVAAWLRSDALQAGLRRLDPARLTEIARLVPELLVGLPNLEPPAPRRENDQRRLLFDAVSAAVAAVGGPVLLMVDDIQHADRETCQLLHYLLRAAPDARLLVAATVRTEELDVDHPIHDLVTALRARERVTEIDLARLDAAETAALSERLSGAALDESGARQLYDETEGNPLFVVEAVRAGWTSGRALGPRVQAVIEARLGQLSEAARQLAGTAAVIGREFSTTVLASVTDGDESALVGNLDELWRRRIIRDQGGDTYDFSHDKIREVAYAAISPPRRSRLHHRIGAALEQAHAHDPGPVSAQIAMHYEDAGAVDDAIAWYGRAAEAAQLLHANSQAVRLLERAVNLVQSVRPSVARDASELELRTHLVAPLAGAAGYASPALSANHQRAIELATGLGVELAPPVLRSLALAALTGSQFAQATQFGRRLQTAADRLDDDVLLVEAGYVLGVSSFWQADFESARRYFELAVARYRPADRLTHLIRYSQDPKVVCLGRLGNTLWFLGQADEARASRSAALAWADEIGDPYTRVVAQAFAALLALDLGDEHDVRMYAAALAAAEPGPPQVDLPAAAFRGYVAVLDGDPDGGIDMIRAAIRDPRSGDAAPGMRACLGRVLLAAGEASGDPIAAVAAADQLLDQGGAACVWAPQARRVHEAFRAHRG